MSYRRQMPLQLRGFRSQRGLVVATMLSLSLGFAGAALVAIVVYGVVFAPLPYQDAEQLVEIWDSWEGTPRAPLTAPEFFALRDESLVFSSVAAFVHDDIVVSDRSEPTEVVALAASAQIFEVLGLVAQVGQVFSIEDDIPGAPGVVILSHSFWKRRFGGDPSVVSQVLICDGTPRVILGVLPESARMPRTFAGAPRADLWIPAQLEPAFNIHYFSVLARLRSDASLELAAMEAVRLAEDMGRRFPKKGVVGRSMTVFPLKPEVIGDVASLAPVGLLSVFLLLVLSLANGASLWWARAEARRDIIWIHWCLGASRKRLLIILALESLSLAVASLLVAIPLVFLGLEGLRAIDPGSIPRLKETHFDWQTIPFVALPAIFASFVLLWWHASRTIRDVGVVSGLPQSGTFSSRDRARRLVIFEAAAAAALLVAAGLLAKSAWNLAQVDLGFDPEGIYSMELRLPHTSYPDPEMRRRFFAELETLLSSSPVVEAAGLSRRLPLELEDRAGPSQSLAIEGSAELVELGAGGLEIISPGFLKVLDISVSDGRGFANSDDAAATPVILVNETLARTQWPGRSPVGARVEVLRPVRDGEGSRHFSQYPGPLTVIGVVEDTRTSPHRPPSATAYVPHAQRGQGAMSVLVRGAGSTEIVIAEVSRLVAELDPRLPIGPLGAIRSVRESALATPRFLSWSVSFFAALVAVLCALAVHASVRHRVLTRTTEIAIRSALGANGASLVASLVLSSLRFVLVGMMIGLAVGVGIGVGLRAYLHEVAPFDPRVLALAVFLLLGLSAASALVPASRANREPLASLLNSSS